MSTEHNTSVGTFEIKVKKIGRKWIEIDSKYPQKVEINDITRDFKVGNTYTIYAKKEVEKNRYGVKIHYYPIDEDNYNELKNDADIKQCKKLLDTYETYSSRHVATRERIVKLANDNKELLDSLEEVEKALKIKEQISELEKIYGKIKNSTTFSAKLSYKIDYALSKLREIKPLTLLKENKNELYQKYEGKCINIITNMLEKSDAILIAVETLDILKEEFDYTNEELTEKFKYRCNNYAEDYITKINKYYNEGYPVNFKNLKIFDYTSNDIKEKVIYMKALQESIDTNKFNYVKNNVFNIRSLESLKTHLKTLNIEYRHSYAQYKAYDGNFYILSYMLDRETFKEMLKEDLLESVEFGHITEYISKDPYMLLHKLIEKGVITLKEETSISEKDKIMLWSDEIIEPFDYRTEEVDGQIYYFVTRELSNDRGNYNAYYLVGWDSDTNRGFSHRLPWKENYYENKAIKEILYETFMFNHGYKRIQGDVIVKEYSIEKNTHYLERIFVIQTINGKEYKKSISGLFSTFREKFTQEKDYVPVDLNSIEKTKKDFSIEYRKGLKVIGEKALHYSDIFLECKVYDKEQLLCTFDTPVMFNTDKVGKKIKYSLYYEDITYDINFEKEVVKEDFITLINETNPERSEMYNPAKFKSLKNKEVALGDHVIKGNVIDISYSSSSSRSDVILCLGPFVIKHSEHSKVEYGEENKAYSITLAIRHKKKHKVKFD